MADRTIYSNECALEEATTIQGDLAASKLRLFDASIVPTVVTTKAELVAAETTLAGYPSGGYALATWAAPLLVTGGGAVITSPLIPVAYASGPTVSIGGGWVEDAAGNVRAIFIFDPARTLSVVGDGFSFVRQLIYGRNAA